MNTFYLSVREITPTLTGPVYGRTKKEFGFTAIASHLRIPDLLTGLNGKVAAKYHVSSDLNIPFTDLSGKRRYLRNVKLGYFHFEDVLAEYVAKCMHPSGSIGAPIIRSATWITHAVNAGYSHTTALIPCAVLIDIDAKSFDSNGNVCDVRYAYFPIMDIDQLRARSTTTRLVL